MKSDFTPNFGPLTKILLVPDPSPSKYGRDKGTNHEIVRPHKVKYYSYGGIQVGCAVALFRFRLSNAVIPGERRPILGLDYRNFAGVQSPEAARNFV